MPDIGRDASRPYNRNHRLADFLRVHQELTKKTINLFYKVYNKLGYGFLEKVYENAVMIEFKKEKIPALAQTPIEVVYDQEVVGDYYADILVDNKIIVELKASRNLSAENEAQLLNFGAKPEVKRRIFENSRKGESGFSA